MTVDVLQNIKNKNILMKNGLPIFKDYDFMHQKLVIEGLSNQQLADELGCSRSAIQSWSKRLEIDKPEALYIRLAENHGDEIKKMYVENGMFLINIAEKFDVSYATIKSSLEYMSVPIKNRVEIKQMVDDKYGAPVKYDLNEGYFKTWSSDMAYILGFIAADGCVHISNDLRKSGNITHRYSMLINLQRRDIDVLEKIKEALGFGGVIRHYKATSKGVYGSGNDYVNITINSKELCSDLIELGIVPRKSLILEYPLVPREYAVDFARGYFDGDGSVGVQYPKSDRAETKTAQIRVRMDSGSYGIIDGIQKSLIDFGLKEKKVISGRSGKIHGICYSTKESLILYELFYKDENCMRMNRKFDRFTEIVELRKNDISKTNGYIKVK